MSELLDREMAPLAERVSKMFRESGISDAKPFSMESLVHDGVVEFSVESVSRGRVVVGAVPQLEIANVFGEAAGDYAGELEAKIDRMVHRGSSVGSGEDTRREVRRLTNEGLTVRQIMERLHLSESTVKKARAATKRV